MKYNFLAICLLLTLSVRSHADKEFEIEVQENLSKFIQDYTNLRDVPDVKEYIPDRAGPLIDYAKKYFAEKTIMTNEAPKDVRDLTCSACIGGVGTIIFDYETLGLSGEALANILTPLCNIVLDKSVCRGAIENYLPEIKYMMDNKGLVASRVCSLFLQGKCGDWEIVNNWEIEIPPGKPEPEEPKLPEDDSQMYKVLHISDVHLDLSYTVGSVADCGKPMCCMNTTEMASDTSQAAGVWGSFTCDLPYWTFEDMLMQIRENHGDEIDYIMITGDFPSHEVWKQSREWNLAHSKMMSDLVSDVFPDKLILPSVGNHESFPTNSYPPHDLDVPEFSLDWLYPTLAQYYSKWMPEDQRSQFIDEFSLRGHYSVVIKPGLRLVMVNPNGCLAHNFWLNWQWVDNNGVLQWLVQVLHQAELSGEKVHIMSHIPPGNGDCLGAWGRNYAKIIERFENIIRAQFFGHTHNDQFLVFYDAVTQSRPLNLGFITPSVTTYTGLNPSYTIYTIDGPGESASYRVQNKEVYIFRLSEANNAGLDERPKYFKLYDAKDDLELSSLFPKDFDIAAKRLATDDEYYDKYFRYYNHDSPGDEHTRRRVVCSAVTVSNIDSRKCDELMGEE